MKVKLTLNLHIPPHPPHKYSSPNKVTTDGINSKQLYHCCSVAKSSPIICDPMDCSILGFPILHYLPGFSQTHIHWVSDAIQPSHSLSPPSPSAFHLSQYQSLFQQVRSLHQVPKVLELQLQHQSCQWIFFRIDWFWSPCCPRDSQESSPAPQFESINSLALSLPYGPTLTSVHDCWKNHSWLYGPLCAKWCLCF